MKTMSLQIDQNSTTPACNSAPEESKSGGGVPGLERWFSNKELVALPEDTGSSPTPTWQPTIIYKTSSRESHTLFWLLWAVHTCGASHTCRQKTQTQKIIKILKYFLNWNNVVFFFFFFFLFGERGDERVSRVAQPDSQTLNSSNLPASASHMSGTTGTWGSLHLTSLLSQRINRPMY